MINTIYDLLKYRPSEISPEMQFFQDAVQLRKRYNKV